MLEIRQNFVEVEENHGLRRELEELAMEASDLPYSIVVANRMDPEHSLPTFTCYLLYNVFEV